MSEKMAQYLTKLVGWGLFLILVTTAFTTAVPNPAVEFVSNQQSFLSGIDTTGVYVRAVLFWTADCRFCRQVVEQDLPPIIEPFGQQLQILYIDVNYPNGDALYQAALQHFKVTTSGSPMLVIGQSALQGVNIAEQLPGLVEQYLQTGGVDWPAIPGLETWIETLPEIMSQPLGSAQCSECEVSAATSSGLVLTQTAQPLQATVETTPEIPVVKAVMFWMDGCPHCHQVLDKVLPPLRSKYREQFQVLLIELVGGQEVAALYDLAASMDIPKEDVGVPFLVIGEHALIGSGQIPEELPGLIDQYLAAGGVDFPDMAALSPLLPTQHVDRDSYPTSTPRADSVQSTPEPSTTLAQLPTGAAVSLPVLPDAPARADGFALAIIVMVGMAGAVIYSILAFIKQPAPSASLSISAWREWATLLLVVVGLGVAGYLAYVETQAATAICGPVGDCNTVQSSPYARLFGVLPIGVLGVFGYLAILAAWVVRRMRQGRWANLAALAIFAMTLGGTLFSLYLTCLEPFVIKAVCMWCITSAVIMTLLLLLNVKPASQVLNKRNTINDETN